MKINFKNTLLVSAVALFSLSACSPSNNLSTAENATAKVQLPPLPTTKTTGHVDDIMQIIAHSLKFSKDQIKEMKMTFDENNYSAEKNSFDISNVQINLSDDKKLTIDRVVRDGNNSLQMSHVHFMEKGYYDSNVVDINKITLLGDLSQEKTIDSIASFSGISFTGSYSHKTPVKIASINEMIKINDAGIENLNVNIKDIDLQELQKITRGAIHSVKGSFSFYKTKSDLLDNNYAWDMDLTGNYGTDLSDKSTQSTLHHSLKMQMNTKALSSFFLAYNKTNNEDDRRNASRNLSSSMEIDTKFVSAILDFKNNGLLNAFYKSDPYLEEQIHKSKTKDELTDELHSFLKGAIADEEIDNLVDVVFNVLLNNKDLHLNTGAVTPLPFKDLWTRIEHHQENVINIKASN